MKLLRCPKCGTQSDVLGRTCLACGAAHDGGEEGARGDGNVGAMGWSLLIALVALGLAFVSAADLRGSHDAFVFLLSLGALGALAYGFKAGAAAPARKGEPQGFKTFLTVMLVAASLVAGIFLLVSFLSAFP
jgi:hypothetical protein